MEITQNDRGYSLSERQYLIYRFLLENSNKRVLNIKIPPVCWFFSQATNRRYSLVQGKKFIGVSGDFHIYFYGVHWFLPKSSIPQGLAPRGIEAHLLCFRFSVRLSAIIAMNSLFVGFPLMFDTV